MNGDFGGLADRSQLRYAKQQFNAVKQFAQVEFWHASELPTLHWQCKPVCVKYILPQSGRSTPDAIEPCPRSIPNYMLATIQLVFASIERLKREITPSMRNSAASILAVSFSVAIALGSSGTRAAFSPSAMRPRSSSFVRSEERSLALPAGSLAKISATLGRNDARYQIAANGQLEARNPVQPLRANFAREGIRVEADAGARWSLAMRGWGYGDHLAQVRSAEPRRDGNRVEYRRGSLVEWYVNGPAGLEQGFTISAPRKSEVLNSKVPLTIVLTTKGNLTAFTDKNVEGSRDLILCDANGRAALRYTGLSARDASGRELAAWMELNGQELRLRIDDTGAHYPVVIDPIIQVAKLTAPNADLSGDLGNSVSISGDGSTIAVGAFKTKVGSAAGEGAVYLFFKSAGWASLRLTASDGVPNGRFGFNVSVNRDGTIIAANGYGLSSPAGSNLYVFTRIGNISYSQTAEFPNIDGPRSLAVSGDGNTIVLGAPLQMQVKGVVYVYSKNVNGWSLPAPLTASDAMKDDLLGYSVSINGDGNTIIAGAPVNRDFGTHRTGAAYVFVKSGTVWSQAAKLTAPNAKVDNAFGQSVGVSSDGNVLAVGAPLDRSFSGTTYVYTASGNDWTKSAELTNPGSYFTGTALAVSSNGDSIAVFGPPVLVYTKEGENWKVAGQLPHLAWSSSIGLSGDGRTVVGGAAHRRACVVRRRSVRNSARRSIRLRCRALKRRS